MKLDKFSIDSRSTQTLLDRASLTHYRRAGGPTSIEIHFDAGALRQPEGAYGLAHLSEHVIIKESKHYPDLSVSDNLLAINGSSWNAHTSMQELGITLSVPDANNFEDAVKILADRICFPLV